MRRTLPLLVPLVGALVASGVAGAEPRLPHETFTLRNGLKVILHEDHSTPQVAIVTWYRVGSKDEVPGRTGFAHLFEHLMFKGSPHVPDGMIDVLLERAGGWSNAFTSSDMTVYQNVAASNFLEMALWLDADRMAGLADALDQPKLDNQRDVVRNERRQNYENQPYGLAPLYLQEALWPKGHGYHWPTIGYHEDLVAADLNDVKFFFDTYYVPKNATMVIAGDIDPKKARALVEKYFGWIPPGGDADAKRPRYAAPRPITRPIRRVETDDVQVPRVYLAWRGPKVFGADEPPLDLAAAILGDGKSSRLYKRLVYDERIAQDVSASFDGEQLGGTFYVVATAKPGVAPERLEAAIGEEIRKLAAAPPTATELERAKNSHEASFLEGLESVLARALQLASYEVQAGTPDFLAKDLERYRAVTAEQVRSAVQRWLRPDGVVSLTIRPETKPDAGSNTGSEAGSATKKEVP